MFIFYRWCDDDLLGGIFVRVKKYCFIWKFGVDFFEIIDEDFIILGRWLRVILLFVFFCEVVNGLGVVNCVME